MPQCCTDTWLKVAEEGFCIPVWVRIQSFVSKFKLWPFFISAKTTFNYFCNDDSFWDATGLNVFDKIQQHCSSASLDTGACWEEEKKMLPSFPSVSRVCSNQAVNNSCFFFGAGGKVTKQNGNATFFCSDNRSFGALITVVMNAQAHPSGLKRAFSWCFTPSHAHHSTHKVDVSLYVLSMELFHQVWLISELTIKSSCTVCSPSQK